MYYEYCSDDDVKKNDRFRLINKTYKIIYLYLNIWIHQKWVKVWREKCEREKKFRKETKRNGLVPSDVKAHDGRHAIIKMAAKTDQSRASLRSCNLDMSKLVFYELLVF